MAAASEPVVTCPAELCPLCYNFELMNDGMSLE